MQERSPDTEAILAGRDESGSLAPAIWPSTTWQVRDFADASAQSSAVHRPGNYSRYANPTVRGFETAIAEVEGAQDALAFGSGMGAMASVVLALCSSGDHVVAQRQIYGGTAALLDGPCKRLGIEVTWVDGTEPGAFAAAIGPRTTLVVAETPSNPLLGLVDLDELGAIRGPFTLVDSTLATPLGQRPLDHGVSLVMHSATKGIAGHNDAMLGVIAGERELIDAIWGYAVLHGATASPHDAANGLRGLRSLGARLDRQCSTSLSLARFLESHPSVVRVHHPGLESHPQHALAMRQMRRTGTMVSAELRGGLDAARRFVDAVRVVRPAVSLGGPETLVCHPATTTHVGMNADDLRAAGIGPGLLRFSVGLEAADDVVADVANALG